MNDPFAPFTAPKPQAPWWRQQARSARRSIIRSRRDAASGESVKQWNSRLNWREFWHGETLLTSFPRTVQVGTNWTCNLKCSFCRLTMPWTQDELKKLPGQQLQISARVESVMEKLLPHAEMLTLTPLGEPLMWRGFKEFLGMHRRFGSRNLAFTTNAMLVKDETAELIVKSEVSQIFVSCDSNDPEIYAGMRVGGELKRVEEGVGRIVAWKKKLGVPWPRLTLCATFMQRNIGQLPAMVRWAQALGCDELSVQLMEIENPAHEPEFLGHHPELARKMVTEALRVGREIGFRVRPHLAIRNLLSAAAEGHNIISHEFGASAPNMPEKYKEELAAINAAECGSCGGAMTGGAASRPGNGDQSRPGSMNPASDPTATDTTGSAASSIFTGPTSMDKVQMIREAAASGAYSNLEGEAPDEMHLLAPDAAAELLALDSMLDMRGKTLVEKCHYPWYNMMIDTDGDVRPCCWADTSWGNLNTDEFDAVWNGARAVGMRKAFLANKIPKSCQKKHCRVDL